MVSQGAKKTRKGYYKRYGKSYEELKEFDVLTFLGGGVSSVSTGGSSIKIGSSSHGITDSVTTRTQINWGINIDLYQKFPLFNPSRKPHYKLYDLPTNMGIVRTRQRQIDGCDRRILKHKNEIKSFKRNDKKIKTRQNWIEKETLLKKKYEHEKDYRQKLLKEISKYLDISKKGSIRKPNNSVKQYRFRIHWWGKRQEVYLGSPSDMKSMFNRQKKFNDFDEFLKNLGRKRFLQRFGSDESNIRKAQRKLRLSR